MINLKINNLHLKMKKNKLQSQSAIAITSFTLVGHGNLLDFLAFRLLNF